ncbi:MAG: terpene cyclase/mutase family protein, partial [Planctomycetes bacterium]|nr:terpene cyclase/mutase family protein [Planctomycetota bacterium]
VAMAGAPGASEGIRSSSTSIAEGPAIAQANQLGSPFDRTGADHLPFHAAAVTMVDVPDVGGDEAVVQASQDHSMSGLADDLPVTRQSIEGGLAANIDAPAGPGGLGADFTPDIGLNNRRASAESVQVQVRSARFVRQQVGGHPDFSTAAIVAAEPFQRRTDRELGNGEGGGHGSPPPMTEEAVELGLAYLSRCQLEDGSWSLQAAGNESAALVSDTAATGLALLAFQGAGYNHREHKYADLVNAAIQYLVKNQKSDGDLFVPLDDESNRSVWIYSHSIAALALCEAYGMTQDPALREPAQKAVDFLVNAQHPDRGGWRYSPQYGSDTSVTGWAMMALKSGELANLQVPEETYDKIRHWLDKAQGGSNEPYLYSYNPYAPNTEEQQHGRRPSMTMTSDGLLMRLYLGWRRDNPNMIRGAAYLAENLPSLGTTRRPERDTYYWYYATQVMFHMGGDYWKAWNGKLHPLLVNSQIQQGPMAGSWDPRNPVPDRWAPHAGRLYVTTMNLISLEVYYRHLPLYEDTAR